MEDKFKNILITGANGFVGRALIKKLAKGSNLFLVSQDKNFTYPGAKIYYGDLSDRSFCAGIISGIEVVYYLAGYKKNITHHTKYPSDFVLDNVEPLVSFLRAVRNSNIKKIIYLSSINVGFYKEGERDGYVVGKYINELILKSFAEQFGMDVKIVRSAGIYGPGDNFNSERANFIPAIIDRVYKSTGEISMWGDGKRKMQFIFIEDLVSNLVAISESNKTFFVIGSLESSTVNDIVAKIVGLSGKNLVIKNDLTKPDKPTQLFEFNNEKNIEFNFDKGLKETVDYYKSINKI